MGNHKRKAPKGRHQVFPRAAPWVSGKSGGVESPKGAAPSISQGSALGIGKKRRSGKPQRGGPNIAQGNALGIGQPQKKSPKGAAPSISQGSALGEGCGEGDGASTPAPTAHSNANPRALPWDGIGAAPLGLWFVVLAKTQGVALGYIRTAPLGLSPPPSSPPLLTLPTLASPDRAG
jgi:hypothetical protein